jgi:stage IV sporulation protein FB
MVAPAPDLHILTIAGIPVRLDATFVVAIVAVCFTVFQLTMPSAAQTAILIVLLIAVVFLSILVHELSHAFMARRRGLAAEEIIVGGFFGFAILEGIPARKRDSILILLAGPLANAVVASGIWLVLRSWEAAAEPLVDGWRRIVLPEPRVLHIAMQWAMTVNIGMAAFNMLPAFPLDGGRIARLMLTRFVADPVAVKMVAATGVFVGVWSLFVMFKYPVLLFLAPLLILVNAGVFKDRDFPVL